MALFRLFKNAVTLNPDKVYLIWEGGEITYGKLYREVVSLSEILQETGVKKGDRVILHFSNCKEIIISYWACWRLEAIAVPITDFMPGKDVEHIIGHSKSTFYLGQPQLYNKYKDIIDNFSLTVLIPEVELSSERKLLLNVTDPSNDDSEALIIYTSGSTGLPKGSLHNQKGLAKGGYEYIEAWGFDEDLRGLLLTSLGYVTGVILHLIPTTLVSGSLYLYFIKGGNLYSLLEDSWKPNWVVSSPAYFMDVLSDPVKTDIFRSCPWKSVMATGDYCHPKVEEKFYEVMGFPLTQSWGMTEVGICTSKTAYEKIGSFGKPLPDVKFRVVKDGKDVPQGEIGELIVCTEHMMLCYWRDPKKTSETIIDGWLYTGDLVHRDEDGYYFHHGRSNTIFGVREGLKISPLEVERVLYQHPYVKEAIVTPFPHAKGIEYGYVTGAFIAFHESEESERERLLEELKEFVSDKMIWLKCPQVYVVLDALPRGSSGKLDRKALKERAQNNC